MYSYSTYDANAYFTKATCHLKIHYTNGYVQAKRQSVAMHEIGHALGLADIRDPNSKTIMNYSSAYRYDQLKISRIQQDDINGINAIY